VRTSAGLLGLVLALVVAAPAAAAPTPLRYEAPTGGTALTLQRAQPVTDRLETDTELVSEQLDVITSRLGRRQDAKASLDVLQLPADAVVVDRNDVERAKPEPDLFLAVQEQLKVRPEECYVVGDAVWDLLAARRAAMLGIGLLSGGYGHEELDRAGAYRVYSNPAELLSSIYQLGLRSA